MRIMVSCRAIDNMAGGVERQAIALINAMVKRGHDVCLLTWDPDGAKAFYKIDKAAHWYQLGMGDPSQKASWALRFKRMKKVRKTMKEFKPDLILAFQTGAFLSLKLYTLGQKIPIIAAIRNAPSILNFTKSGKKYKNFIHQSLRLADLITVQFENYRAGYPSYLHHKIKSVSNAIAPASNLASPCGKTDDTKVLLAVGRLSFQKNFNLLIRAFAQLSDAFPEWKLFIAGDGEQRDELEQLIQDLNVEDIVEMPGTVEDVESLYCTSHIFCLPSLWEGFPNALSEALMHGLPCVGFEQCEGVNILIKNEENGLLARNRDKEEDSVKSLAECLKTLMRDENLRTKMGQAAAESMKPYYPEAVFDQWENIMKDVSNA